MAPSSAITEESRIFIGLTTRWPEHRLTEKLENEEIGRDAPNKSWLKFCCGSSPLSAHFCFAYLPTIVKDGVALQSTSCLQITKAKAAFWLGNLTHSNLIGIYRTLHPTTAKHAFFSSTYCLWRIHQDRVYWAITSISVSVKEVKGLKSYRLFLGHQWIISKVITMKCLQALALEN